MLLFLLFLIIDIYFLIPGIIAHIFNPIAELVIPFRIPTKEEKEEMEIHPVTVEDKIKKFSVQFRVVQKFLFFTNQFISIYFFK